MAGPWFACSGLFVVTGDEHPVTAAAASMAREVGPGRGFLQQIQQVPEFAQHFGDPADGEIRYHYLEAMHRFATDTLPPAPQRHALVPEGDHRRRTAGRHTLDGDVMWFAWALHLEATHILAPARKAPPP